MGPDTTTEMEYAAGVITVDYQAEQRSCEVEDRSFEIIHEEENKPTKRMKKREKSFCHLWDTIKRTIFE